MELKQIAEYALKQTGVREAAAEWDALDAAQRRAASGGDVLTKQVEIQEKAVTRINSKLNTLANSELTNLEKAYMKVQRAEALEGAARDNGIKLTDAQILGINRVRQKYEELRTSVNGGAFVPQKNIGHISNDNARLAPHEWTNLSRQIQDVVTMGAMGASPLQIITSQGAQFFDIFTSSSIGAKAALADFGSTALRVATHPLTILVTSVTAAAGTSIAAMSRWKSATDELQASLDGLGRTSGLSLTGARGLAESAAAQSGLSLRASSGIVSGALGAGLDAASAGGVASIAKEFSVKLGVGLDDVAKELMGALPDPAKGADELARRYGLVTMAQAHHIDQLVKVGDRSGAAAELLRDLHQALDQIADRRSPFSRLIDRLEAGASDALMRYGESLANNPANATVNRLFGVRGNESASTVFSRMRSGELQRRQAERQADLAGQDILGIARETAPDLFARRDIEAQIEKFQRALGKDGVGKVLDQLGVSGDTVRQTLDRMRVGLELLQSPVQRVTEANSLAARSADAETAGQKAQIAAEQAFRAELQSSHDRLAAVTAAEGARNVVLLESARALRDEAKDARHRADIAGLNPYQRMLRETEYQYQRDLKRADTAPGAGADKSVFDRSVVVPFDRAGTAATRLADALTSSADRIGRLVSLPDQKAATASGTPFFARAGFGQGGDFYRSIMRAEGTDKFGDPYNTSLGYMRSPKPLVEMTMAESLAWGDQVRRAQGLNSSAKGAFQITNRTQRDAMRALGLGANDLFNVENQNRMADWIFKTQGIGAWEGFKRPGVTLPAAGRASAASGWVGENSGEIEKNTSALEKRNAARREWERSNVDQWIKGETMALDEQRRAIELSSGAWGANRAAIAAAEEKQRLLNEAQRLGIDVSKAYGDSTKTVAERLDELAKKAADNARALEERRIIAENLDIARSGLSGSMSGSLKAIANGENVGQALNQALTGVRDRIFDTMSSRFSEALLGPMGSASGGILGSLFGFGGGQQSVGTMSVNAGLVNVNGGAGIPGVGGTGGGFLGGIIDKIGSFFGSIGQNADGTDNWRGGLTWVGERGPELLNLPRGSQITSSERSMAFVREQASAARSHAAAMAMNDNRGSAPTVVSPPVTVNLIGAPQGTEVKESSDGKGGRRIDVVIAERVAAGMASAQGRDVFASMGVRPRLARM